MILFHSSSDFQNVSHSAHLGVETSPNYPEKYPNNLNKWTKRIEVEEGLVLSLKFTAFDVEDGGSKCSYDYLEIFDEKKNQLMKSCGSSLPDPITTKTNIVDLVFVTDGSEQKTGWKITWTAMKQGGGSPIHLALHCVFYALASLRPI